jgi:alginate O-acetyltransferase complex protein AlgI
MIFSSNIFLFVFLPVFMVVYYLTPVQKRSWVIIVGSYTFYAWWRLDFLALFAAVTCWSYLIGLKIGAAEQGSSQAKNWVMVGVVLNLATLAYFKYANFGVAVVSSAMVDLGLDPWLITHVILPIGISFYSFQAISYLIDVYRHDTPATHNLIDFAAFIALFPQLIAGPVLRYKDVAGQFQHRIHSWEKFSEGAQRFMVGFIKKVIIADTLAPLVNAGFALENPSMLDAWLAVLAYSAQLYFDFSGYADMAIGLGLMMGFRFMENFKHPYISQSITEFWRRWHISLSTWLRDYLYIPLGGSKHGRAKTYRNLCLTMLLGGLWHGANWTFLVWGAWHGCLLAVEKLLGVNTDGRLFSPTRCLLTLFFVMIGWVVFRAESLSSAMILYSAMFSFETLQLSQTFSYQISSIQIFTLTLAWGTMVYCGLRQHVTENQGKPAKKMLYTVYSVALVPLFMCAILKLSAQSYSAFLYFQF